MTGETREIEYSEQDQKLEKKKIPSLAPVSELYQDWFLEYASYVILERAVPALEDGLKPVQRRILHAMKETDDGRFNKVANIIGNTMQYHPHGDASIGDAIVGLGQRDLLIETQGNWGDIVTGDNAAAPRYIEARLSKISHEVVFNPDITEWQLSYDGRKKEPVLLPVKIPLVLVLGAEGIAVGLSTKILPHNFVEVINACISYLKNEDFEIFPDFPTNGMADFTNYNEGQRGGRVRVRSKIEPISKTTLAIRNVPFGVTTTSLIESILKANDSGKIKIKSVTDNTARNVEIIVEIPKGVSPDVTIDALYAFTNCEVSISPNACVIYQERPVFLKVSDIVRISTDRTVDLLKKELELKLAELENKWHFTSLEKIFFEKKIYKELEKKYETWDLVIDAIDTAFGPYKKFFKRDVTRDDILKLTEKPVRRIYKLDIDELDNQIKSVEEEIKKVKYDLAHIVDFAIKYYTSLIEKFGKGRERKTEIRTFDTIEAKSVAAANRKLYVNRKEGFIGFGLKKEEPIGECSELDDIIAFRKDGKFIVVKVDDKVFVGKDIIHVDVFKKDDERMTYNAVYLDGANHWAMCKRFNVSSITRDKEYDITRGNNNSRVIYFTANPHGESEVVTVHLAQTSKARKKIYDFDFGQVGIKNRNAVGVILTKYPVRKIIRKSVDTSNVIGIDVWYDEHVGKLNIREIGKYLGNFTPDDLIAAFYDDGTYELTSFDLNNHYNYDKLKIIEQFEPDRIITAVYFNPEQNNYFVKRFTIETTTTGRPFKFISEHKDSKLIFLSLGDKTIIQYKHFSKKFKTTESANLELSEFVDVMGWKAVGRKLPGDKISDLELLEIIYDEPEESDEPELEIEPLSDEPEEPQNFVPVVTEKEKPNFIPEKSIEYNDKSEPVSESEEIIFPPPGEQLKLF